MKRNITQDDIVDHVGAPSWESVIESFEDMSLDEIKAHLNNMYPLDDTSQIAEAMFYMLKYGWAVYTIEVPDYPGDDPYQPGTR